MTKKNLAASIDIDAAPEDVWRVVSDLSRMPQWSPQCRAMRVIGAPRPGAYTLNVNRQGRKFWPTASKITRFEPMRAIAFRTLTNNSVWSFEITPTASGSTLCERRGVPERGTSWVSETIVEHFLGGEADFDDEMLDGMHATLARMKAVIERDAR